MRSEVPPPVSPLAPLAPFASSRRAVLKLVAGAVCLPAVALPGIVARAADPAPLVTFTDPEGRFTLQHLADWQVQDVPADATGVLNGAILHLQGPGVNVLFYQYAATLTLDGQITYHRDINPTDNQYVQMYDAPEAGRIGGEPARAIRSHYTEQANPMNMGVLTTWFVDHGGIRYQLRLDDDYDRHRAELDALIASITFAPVPLADYADANGRITLRYPQYWKASRQTDGPGADSSLLQLDGENLTVYVNAFQRLGTLDDAIAEYRNAVVRSSTENDTTFDPPRNVLIGGKPGRSIAVRQVTKGHPEYAPYITTTYFMDYAGQRFRFVTGNFNSSHTNELLAMMQSVTLVPQPFDVYEDEARTVTFQYPRGWMPSHLTAADAAHTNLVLDATSVHLTFIADLPNTPLENTVQQFLDDAKTNAAYTVVTDDMRADDRVGNEPARTLTFRYRGANDAEGVYGIKRIWFVDHGDLRYIFQCSDYRVSGPEINDLIASVAFAPIATTTFTDPQQRITLQYPSTWMTSSLSGGIDILRASLKYNDMGTYTNLIVYAFRPIMPSLDAELMRYMQQVQEANTGFVYTFDAAPQSTQIGGEPARSLGVATTRKENATGLPSRATVWMVDHADYRYEFIFSDSDVHGKQMIAVLDSVRFLP